MPERPDAFRNAADAAPVSPGRHARRIVRSFGYALEGLAAMLRSQPNAWVHLAAASLALGLGMALGLSAVELAVVVLTIGLVLAAEAANTALEHVCDLVSPDYHPLVKRAKDISAAAVLVAAIVALVVAALIYVPHLRL